MLAYLEERVSLQAVIWLFPLLFLLHDGKEVLNVFSHLGATITHRAYTPGVLTAPTVALPGSLYILHRLMKAGLVGWRSLGLSLLLALALAGPLVFAAHGIGKLLVP